jgi:hypothetical protein
LINQSKQQFLFQGVQGSLASTATGTLASFSGVRLIGRMHPLIRLREGGQ